VRAPAGFPLPQVVFRAGLGQIKIPHPGCGKTSRLARAHLGGEAARAPERSRMDKRITIFAALLSASALLLAPALAGAAPMKTEVKKTALRRGSSVAPLPKDRATRSHAPFEGGDCGVCHQRNDAANPGPIRQASVNEQCFECHDDVRDVMASKFKHVPAAEACTDCHNPHNSTQPALLAAEMTEMCTTCHTGIKAQVTAAKVKHDALTTGKKCANCHNPHAANVEKLLIALPFDLCVSCHSRDDMKSDDGKTMTNFKKWLDENPVWHDPVKGKDCSACHRTHGGDNFRLLVEAYPAKFYAPYDEKLYALCYGCHDGKVVSERETTTLTGFRDGARNLHFVHVNRERGRTCRACHEVHASKQAHQVRDGVPYGPKGWMLKIGYTKLPNGGSCAKTCHDTKTYDNKTPARK
jgi:predicted CXXCH cytochrome family protein